MDIKQDDVAFFIPPNLTQGKVSFFRTLGDTCGRVIRDAIELETLPDHYIPMVGCTASIGKLVHKWLQDGRPFLYWDRGYWHRHGYTALKAPEGNDHGMYRLHFNSFQMTSIADVPPDRFNDCPVVTRPWQKGRTIVIAAPSIGYSNFHGLHSWTSDMMQRVRRHTKRPIVVRQKAMKPTLEYALRDAFALVTHGSNAAVESVILGVPVFVDPSSGAAPMGRFDVTRIEDPVYPDRQAWLNSLAYHQFTRDELIDGTALKTVMGVKQCRPPSSSDALSAFLKTPMPQ